MLNKKQRLLITGCSGLLGNNLLYYFKNYFQILGLFNSNKININGVLTKKCNILDKNSIREIFNSFQPEVIIHCAALSDVDLCEINESLSEKINVSATKYLVEASNPDSIFIYISTDSVYDGIKGNFSEEDNLNPLNYYGITKLRGEKETLKKEKSVVLRTNFYGWNILQKQSIIEWIIINLRSKQKINCFNDAIFSSMYTFDLAKIIQLIIKKELNGIYNCGASNYLSKYEFAKKVAEIFNFDQRLINPISIDEFLFKAKRGKNQSLDITKIQKDLDYKIDSMEIILNRCFKDFQLEYPFKIH